MSPVVLGLVAVLGCGGSAASKTAAPTAANEHPRESALDKGRPEPTKTPVPPLGTATPVPQNTPARAPDSSLRTGRFFALVVSGYLTKEEKGNGRRRFGGFEPERVEAWPVDDIAAWLPDDKVIVEDTNLTPPKRSFTRDVALKQLKSRNGLLHYRLAHVAYFRSAKDAFLPDKADTNPMVQRIRNLAEQGDSKVVERVEGGHVIAELGRNDTQPMYRLTFTQIAGGLRLSRLEYTHLDENCYNPDEPQH